MDPRHRKLSDLLVGYSLEVSPGMKVYVEAFDVPDEFVCTLVDSIADAGALPIVATRNNRVLRSVYMHATDEQMRLMGEVELHRMKAIDAYIGVRGADNVSEMADVPSEKMKLYQHHYWLPVHSQVRVTQKRWVVLRYPTPSMAQMANMSTESFEEFYYSVCTLDYSRMKQAVQPLQELMAKTDRVRLVAPGTDLTFSIKGIPSVPCVGGRNIPDGELFTAPVKDSVNGTLRYNVPTVHHGVTYENVAFEFAKGRIEKATASGNVARLNEVLDSDEGARYVGEFSLGFNPFVLHPMKDTLFDEKIAGSFHFTPGNAYDEADNGNRSEVHWDLVLIQRPEYGGGEVWFDDQLIRKDGLFTLPDLQGLNPDSLASS
ncbi:MAG TPA: aminopeptidase [Armatimonadota bacterium]|jgi:aminopeptidase